MEIAKLVKCTRPQTASCRSDWRCRTRAGQAVPIPNIALRAECAGDGPMPPPKADIDCRGRWLVVHGFVSAAERSQLLEKALCHMRRRELHPNPCGPGRFFAKADDQPGIYVDPLLERMTRRCTQCLRLQGVAEDLVRTPPLTARTTPEA